jgi:tetratricopeptide (TPR) repeat protein
MAVGDYFEAARCAREIIAGYESFRCFPDYVAATRAIELAAMARSGQQAIDPRAVGALDGQVHIKYLRGVYRRMIGDAVLHSDEHHIDEAGAWIRKAIDADSENGTRWDLAMDYALYGKLFQRKGDLRTAREQLTKAIEIFTECGADGWVKRTEEKLAQL